MTVPTSKRKALVSAPEVRHTTSPGALAKAKPQLAEQKNDRYARVTFRIPEAQAKLLERLKARCSRQGLNAKKGEIIGAALQLLAMLPDEACHSAVQPLVKPRAPVNGKMRKKN